MKLYISGHFKTIIAVLLSTFLLYEIFLFNWYVKAIPPKIQIAYPVTVGEDTNLFRGGCGIAVYRVSDKTIEATQKSGLKFLDDATRGKESDRVSYVYEKWRETPVPPSWVSEGSWFMCSPALGYVIDKIVTAAKEPGSFYTTTESNGKLVLIPSLGYIVFSHYEG